MEWGWQALLETSSELGCLLDAQGSLLTASPGWRGAFGDSSPSDQLLPTDRAHFAKLVQACRAGPQRIVVRLGESQHWYDLLLTFHGEGIVLNVQRSQARLWHDLLTPVNVIEGFAELLEEAELTPTHREYLTEVSAAAAALRELIRQAAAR